MTPPPGWRWVICRFKGAVTLDALRAFRAAYINKGPEFIPVPE